MLKDIPGLEGLYQASDDGRIYSVRNKLFLKQAGGDDYHIVTITCVSRGIRKQEYVHRLVAMAFLENPHNYTEVNHKDECKTNNCVDNLEWCDHYYNINYGSRNKRIADSHLGMKYKQREG